jgi:hypothetical protein
MMFSLPKAMAEDSIPTAAKKKVFTAIVFAPLNLFDPYNPSFQIGVQREVIPDMVVQAELGIMIPNGLFRYMLQGEEFSSDNTSSTTGPANEHHTGWKLRAEARQILVKKQSSSVQSRFHLFVGAETFGMRSSADYTSVINSGSGFHQDMLKIGLNAKAGAQGVFRHFLIEVYGGLGFAYYNIKHSNIQGNGKAGTFSLNMFYEEGERWRWNLPFNIKIGYVF